MKTIRNIFAICDKLLGLFTTFIAAVILLFSGYVLYDNFYKSTAAFSSFDLQQYKPTLKETKLGFSDILALNPDTVAWLTIDGTNIDYPILQGRDDLEYINKDIYGKSSLTGSLYLRTENNADFSDNYNLIYGHHMENGAMFGDIGKYIDQSFFDAHRSGILMSPAQNYDIKIFAAMKTDAYNDLLYFEEINSSQKYNTVIEYIEKNSVIFKNDTPRDKIIAFSTCMDFQTNGRTMVFASLTPLTGVIAKAEDPTPIKRTATGHYTNSKGWAFLNLLCVICTLLTLLPFIFTGNKYYQFVYAAKMSKEEKNEIIAKDLRFFKYKIIAGTLTEILCLIFSVLLFVKTQYLKGQISVIDKYTVIMIAIFALTLLADIIFFRYRGKRPET
ncbi:MAG TPA: SrtB family sortase [Lachnospiraceae bacterium]|nr:SrtB family sortase [Lachnospiraceae bacterium]